MLEIKSAMALGAVLRETRTAQQLRAEDLAAMLGISPTTLRRMEQGDPPAAAIRTLFQLLDELGIQLHASLPPGVESIQLPNEQSRPRRTRVRP